LEGLPPSFWIPATSTVAHFFFLLRHVNFPVPVFLDFCVYFLFSAFFLTPMRSESPLLPHLLLLPPPSLGLPSRLLAVQHFLFLCWSFLQPHVTGFYQLSNSLVVRCEYIFPFIEAFPKRARPVGFSIVEFFTGMNSRLLCDRPSFGSPQSGDIPCTPALLPALHFRGDFRCAAGDAFSFPPIGMPRHRPIASPSCWFVFDCRFCIFAS